MPHKFFYHGKVKSKEGKYSIYKRELFYYFLSSEITERNIKNQDFLQSCDSPFPHPLLSESYLSFSVFLCV